jgi:hypothetical protein
MPAIEVDFDVFKELTRRRPNETVTENDILRQLLGLGAQKNSSVAASGSAPGEWITKGVRFPAGTEFRATYKGKTYLARVENGALVLNGQRFDSPSAGAMSITRKPVNGWTFWEARQPGRTSWQIIKALRSSAPASG